MSGSRRRPQKSAQSAAPRKRSKPRLGDLTHAQFGAILGARIRERRLAAGLSQADLAGTTLSRFAISKIEMGASLPSLATLRQIARGLGVSARDLIGPDL